VGHERQGRRAGEDGADPSGRTERASRGDIGGGDDTAFDGGVPGAPAPSGTRIHPGRLHLGDQGGDRGQGDDGRGGDGRHRCRRGSGGRRRRSSGRCRLGSGGRRRRSGGRCHRNRGRCGARGSGCGRYTINAGPGRSCDRGRPGTACADSPCLGHHRRRLGTRRVRGLRCSPRDDHNGPGDEDPGHDEGHPPPAVTGAVALVPTRGINHVLKSMASTHGCQHMVEDRSPGG
jgi:hypothetical protein